MPPLCSHRSTRRKYVLGGVHLPKHKTVASALLSAPAPGSQQSTVALADPCVGHQIVISGVLGVLRKRNPRESEWGGPRL